MHHSRGFKNGRNKRHVVRLHRLSIGKVRDKRRDHKGNDKITDKYRAKFHGLKKTDESL